VASPTLASVARGLIALRADDKQYHDNLFDNVLTYIYGSAFGVAVLERIEEESFNPNVSLEIGYMYALGRPVLLLKDQTLRTLHTDLMARLYKQFDSFRPNETLPAEVERWLREKGFAGSDDSDPG
jgi:nucleoside 2-deoxyribosyltransferase